MTSQINLEIEVVSAAGPTGLNHRLPEMWLHLWLVHQLIQRLRLKLATSRMHGWSVRTPFLSRATMS